MANKIKLHKGDIEDFYEASDSDEYTERDKSLLNKVRKSREKNEDSEEEVLPFDDDAEEDDFEETLENSDFEEDEHANDGIPDARAWGKKRKDFYSTDFVDQDYSSYNANEEQLAEQEENEARDIQQRLAKQLDEGDFTLDVYGTKATITDSDASETNLKTDLSDMSEREKIQMFRKDSPEFEGLVEDFEQRLQESQTILEPIVDYFKSKNIAKSAIVNFVTTKNNLILTYCSNVAFYLVLKAKRIPIKNHPLVKRLVQMRQLLLQLEDKYTRIVKPQLEKLLVDISNGQELIFHNENEPSNTVGKQSKRLRFLHAMETENKNVKRNDDQLIQVPKTPKLADNDASSDSDEDVEMEAADEETENDRRQITYQMAKNKGLTPHRKKELRNPRVKHRNKFRKAIIRRKGAVRTVRKELNRYSGEVSGIKASTKKGIKIK